MKYIYRRPLLPFLYALLLLGGVTLTLLFSENMAGNRRAVDEMYANARIQFRVLPGTAAAAGLELPLERAERLKDTGLITQVYRELHCPVAAASENGFLAFQTAYGTSNIAAFSQTRNLSVAYGEGYDDARFQEKKNLCLIEARLAEKYGLVPGDRIELMGCMLEYMLMEDAAPVELTLAGTYTNGDQQLLESAILVSDELFMAGGGLIYNNEMAKRWQYYTNFSFILDPAHNREYHMAHATLQEELGETTSFLLYSDSRVLENAIQPLERRLQTQDTLLPLLQLSLVAGCALLSVLMALYRKNDLLIRLVFGERRLSAMGKEWCGVCLAMAPGAALAGIVLLIGALYGVSIASAAGLCGSALVICLLLPLLTWTLSGGRLIQLYQSFKRNE